jgi:hypothetical protein
LRHWPAQQSQVSLQEPPGFWQQTSLIPQAFVSLAIDRAQLLDVSQQSQSLSQLACGGPQQTFAGVPWQPGSSPQM